MKPFRRRLFALAGYTTVFMGTGRPEFKPGSMPHFEAYLQETAQGTSTQLPNSPGYDEGIIGSFMSGRFLNQANLPGFLPFIAPSLLGKPCTAVEGACGTGGRAIATAARSILAETSDLTFVAAFEMQNTMKSLYGADVLAGAAHYSRERQQGHAYFFPGLFAERAGAYFARYGEIKTREALAKWYEQAILNARHCPKAQEYHNTSSDLYTLGMTPPDANKFIPYLNYYDCSKVSDGAVSIVIASEEGLQKTGLQPQHAIEIIAIGEAQGDITVDPEDPTVLSTTALAVQKALEQAELTMQDIGLLELHDCFSISGLLALEAIGVAKPGQGPEYMMEGHTGIKGKLPTNLSGGLIGFGHPTGASGVRQLVDLLHQFTKRAANQATPRTPFGMLISMGGNDKTVTCVIVKSLQ